MRKKEIILMNAPFSDLSLKKIKPALVLAKIQDDLLVCFISSKINKTTLHDVLVKADAKNRLKVDSVVRCNKIFTLHTSLSKGVLGEISSESYESVVQKITEIIS